MSHVIFEVCAFVVFYIVIGIWAVALHLDEENPFRGFYAWPVILISHILECIFPSNKE